MEAIGQRIRRLRRERGFVRQIEFAPMVLMTQSSLSDVESKNKAFTAQQLMALCRVLKVSPEHIVFGGEEEVMGTVEMMQPFKALPPQQREFLLTSARALVPQQANQNAA